MNGPASRAVVAFAALALAGCGRRNEPPAPKAETLPDAVVVRLSYGSEKKGFLEESVEAFHAKGPKTSGGRPIRIVAVAEGSAESMEAILAGESDATVWSPASSLLVDVLNQRWAEKNASLGSGRKLVADPSPLVLSPVVIAIWEPMARALGWPARRIGWKEIAEMTAESRGWGGLGHPEWGAFRFGHTHPRFSNSGAIALVAATYAGAGKTRDLVEADVSKAAPFVRKVEAGVVHYGRSTGFFAEKMFTRGPAYMSAAVLYENLVVEAGTDPAYASKAFPVVALYPAEGTFWADHPWAVLDVPAATPEVREGAESFRKFLVSPERQKRAMERFGFRPSDPSIPLGAPIDAAHGLDPAQPANVLPNPPVAVTRAILDSFEAVKRPVAVTFVLDTSGSMKGEPLKQARDGAKVFLGGLPKGDLVRVLLFSNETRWVSRKFEPVGQVRAQLEAALDGVFAGGGTALYRATMEACEEPSEVPAGAVRAVVVLTDGRNTDDSMTLEALVAKLRRQSGTEEAAAEKGGEAPRVFTIGYGPEADPAVLRKVAEAGGGAFFAGTPKNISSVYAELASFF
jgi:Ca-activated chloride channel family protein